MKKSVSAISIRDLSYSYDRFVALDRVSVEAKWGDFVALIGPNGAGKSTLAKIIVGLLRPTSGTVIFGGASDRPGPEILAYVPQKFSFDRHIPMTVLEFLRLVPCRSKTHCRPDAATLALGRYNALSLADSQLSSLSGGEMQRVLLARATQHDPKILILDEPASGIDAEGESVVHHELKRHAEAGGLVILVSHDLSAVSRYANRVWCLDHRLIEDGDPHTILSSRKLSKLYAGSDLNFHRH